MQNFTDSARVATSMVSYIYGRQSCDTRSMEESETDIDQGNAKFGGQEATVIFDRVFVPYKHVFMNGEVEFAAELCVSRSSFLCSSLTPYWYTMHARVM